MKPGSDISVMIAGTGAAVPDRVLTSGDDGGFWRRLDLGHLPRHIPVGGGLT